MTGEQARGFPAFPPTRGRARTWWGRAWVSALQDTALDEGQLRQGRKYAAAGYVGAITVSPGRVAASVRDYEDDTTYRTQVRFEPLTSAGWTRFLDQVAAQAGHIAALLERDVPRELAAAAEDAGVRLLPGIGDLEPECTCPGWELPCRHAAALAYQVSWLLDADPFVLLLLRGRGEQELLDELHGREVRDEPGGVPAAQALSVPVPALTGPPPAIRDPLVLPDFAPADGVDPAALAVLVANAAGRAAELLAAGELPHLDAWQDTVRIAAAHPAIRARLATADLDRAVRAWQLSGLPGLAVLHTPWTPAKADLARARAVLAAAWEGDEPPAVEHWRNRWTLTGHGLQVRYGRDGRWYAYRRDEGEWWPAGPAAGDPASALGELIP